MKSIQKIMLILILILTFSVSAAYADLFGGLSSINLLTMPKLSSINLPTLTNYTTAKIKDFKASSLNAIYDSGAYKTFTSGVSKYNYSMNWARTNLTSANLTNLARTSMMSNNLTRQLSRPIVSSFALGAIASKTGLPSFEMLKAIGSTGPFPLLKTSNLGNKLKTIATGTSFSFSKNRPKGESFGSKKLNQISENLNQTVSRYGF